MTVRGESHGRRGHTAPVPGAGVSESACGAQPSLAWTARRSVPCDSATFAELGAAVLRLGVGVRFAARGMSMQPLVQDGDLLTVQPVVARRLWVGDVALCMVEPGRVVAHRVLRKVRLGDGLRIVVQGDRASQPDGALSADQILGRVALIERGERCLRMDAVPLRVLGWMTALRSRGDLPAGALGALAVRWLRRMPGLRRYLA